MIEHDWEIETIDGGPAGVADFYKCKNCFASGGPVGWNWRKRPFLAGEGLQLSQDCSEAVRQIQEYYERKK